MSYYQCCAQRLHEDYTNLLLVVFSPWAGLEGTRAQSGDRYGSGMLHSGQVLRGSLPLFPPAFRCSHFRYQMPPCPQQHERS
jgi:hypothetical protein